MKERIYNILAFVGRICLPALATLYLALADIWSLPFKIEISATLTAVSAFLNTVLMIDSNKYFNGKEIVEDTTLDGGRGE